FELKEYQHGIQDVIFNATDRIAYTEAIITIDVRSVNNPPVLKTIGPQKATEEEYLYVPLKAIEVEGQTVKWKTNVSEDYEKENYMDNIYIQKDLKDKYKATLVYLPKNSDVPVVYVNVSVQDQMHTAFEPSIDWEHVTITVANVNDVPSFTKIDLNPVYDNEIILTATQDNKKLIYFQAYDDDILNGDDLEFSSDALPGVDGDNFTMVELHGTDIPLEYRGFNTEVAMVEWRPKNKHVGEYIINANVSDKDEAFDSVKLRFLVKNVNDPPVIVSREITDPADYEKHTNREFVNLSCVVDDPDLYIPDSTEKLNVTWYSNVSKLLGYGTSIKNIKLKAGMHEIEILVKDASGEDNDEARDYLLVVVEKAITLQKYCEQSYGDFPPEDDIEYSYNDKTKKFTVSQGRNEEANPINLTAYYDNGKLVIELTFATDIDLTTDFIIKIYIVTYEHDEPTPNYKKEYSSKFFEVELYQPPEDVTYGFFSKNDGFVVNNDMFVVKYSLADLEIGTSRFEPLKANFKIFAIVKWHEIEYFPKYRVENFRYDSIGYGAALAPPPISSSNGGSDPVDINLVIGVSSIIIIIIIILIII
ncbi:MAG: hypothetical protein KAJ51_12140, partial [Thermoplasmata archaeon]|nr:hypothetical protein [Thermoplasmata archaeon]